MMVMFEIVVSSRTFPLSVSELSNHSFLTISRNKVALEVAKSRQGVFDMSMTRLLLMLRNLVKASLTISRNKVALDVAKSRQGVFDMSMIRLLLMLRNLVKASLT